MELRTDLYQAILARRSVRRYAPQALDEGTLAQIEELAATVVPLIPENRFRVLLRDVAPGQDLVKDLGAYGRLLSAPHYLVPCVEGDACPRLDWGFRVEQLVVHLTAMGVASCYVGSVGREDWVRDRYGLPAGARIGAFLVFGHPADSLGGRALNAAIRRVVGATNKHPPEDIYFDQAFDRPGAPPQELAPLVEAARRAPSADNAQPWRLLWREGVLYLFVRRRNPRYGAHHQEYRFYDGGICMGNVQLALQALGREGHWEPLADASPGLPDRPDDLQPLARLPLD